MNLRDLQTNLPWTIKYSTDFRSSPIAHKDFAHTLHHVGKALGRLHELADNMDHDRNVALGFEGNRDEYAKYIADLVVCALRLANTFPGGVVDLEWEVVARIELKNGVALPSTPRGLNTCFHPQDDECSTSPSQWCACYCDRCKAASRARDENRRKLEIEWVRKYGSR